MISALLLIAAVVGVRLLGAAADIQFVNFAAMGAIVLCCAAYLPRRWAIIVPLSAWLLAEIPLNMIHGFPLVTYQTAFTLAAFTLVFMLGWKLRGHRRPLTILAGSVAAACLFYLLTNFAAFLTDPLYPKTWSGFLQSMWLGPVGSPVPTWVFFRNTLAGNLLFTALFLVLAAPRVAPRALPEADGDALQPAQ